MSNYVPLFKQVRGELMAMQRCGGAMIKPFALYQVVSMILSEEEKAKLGVKQIRLIVETYCALCNEFFIIYCFDKNSKNEFYMSEERWDKYFIDPQSREYAIKFLCTHGFIQQEEKVKTDESTLVTTYKIDLDMLKACRRLAEEWYEESKSKKRKFLE